MEKIKLANINLCMLGVLLTGYAFFDRAFAYIGYSPLFISEVVLAISLSMFIVANPNFSFLRAPISWALLIFTSWQVIILTAFGPPIDLFALRDSAAWYYSIFAIIVAATLLKSHSIDRTLEWYARLLPWFVIWAPIGFLIQVLIGESLPLLPGTDIGILNLKPGDMQVHLAGAIIFMMLGLNRTFPKVKKISLPYMEYIFWAFLCFGVITYGSRGRAGMLSIIAAVAVVMVLKPKNRILQFLLPAIFVLTLFSMLDVRVPLPGGREISTNQIVSNVESVIFFGDEDRKRSEQQETADWRLEWWQIIIDETIGGKFFWKGRGYGPNLSEEHGFADATANRSPHNGHLTILARSGVPGLVLWIILIATIYLTLLRRYFSALRANEDTAAKVDLWVMGYLTAFFINMSLDVYLEGPQGGIWFWSLVGFVIALTETQRTTAARRTRTQLGSVRQIARP